jgi:hypothetical protein
MSYFNSGPAIGSKPVRAYTGKVVYIYAFDVAHEMNRKPIATLQGQPVAQFSIDASKRSPRQLFFYRPQMVRLPPIERIGPLGSVCIERTVKMLPLGSLGLMFSVPFTVQHIEDLVVFHDLQFNNGSLHAEVRQLAEELRQELAPYYIRPVPKLNEEEAYTVFCLEAPLTTNDGLTIPAEAWHQQHRREIAALLTQEPDAAHLSEQEASESTDRYLTYYEHDLVVVDWDAALLLDHAQNFEETLYLMELANLQLSELEAYDRILDDALERSYRDLGTSPTRRRREVQRELREIRIDLTRMSDELSNTSKFFGDWHQARIYQALSSRFHLSDWHKTIDEKLKTLDDLYHLLQQDQNNRWMMILEVTIVLLFIADLIIILLGPGR